MAVLNHTELEELRITHTWANFILYCRRYLKYGEIRVRIVNGEPTEPLDEKAKRRFDKPETLPDMVEEEKINWH